MAEEGKGLVIVMRAVPGSGKSTFARQLKEKLEAEGKTVVKVSADDYFYEKGAKKAEEEGNPLAPGEERYEFVPWEIGEAHAECFRRFLYALGTDADVVIVDNTNLGTFEISPYKLAADAMGYDFVIKELQASPEEAFKRQTHGVPQATFERMHRTFQETSMPPWWEKEEYQPVTGPGGEAQFEPVSKPEGPEQMTWLRDPEEREKLIPYEKGLTESQKAAIYEMREEFEKHANETPFFGRIRTFI
jgi:hypothetical protein